MTRLLRIARAATLFTLAAAPVTAQSLELTPAQIREDIAWFRRDVLAVEQSYTSTARAEAERRLASLESNADHLTPVAFEIGIARIVALADNGHSGVNAAGRSRRYNRVPVRFGQFGDEVRVLRAGVAHADLLGAKLVALDGRPLATARDSARTLFGGVPAWRDRNVPLVFESPAQLHAIGVARDAQSTEYAFETASGARLVRRIVAEAAGSVAAPDMLLYAQPDTNASWVSVRPESMPWTLAEPMTAFRSRPAPEVDGMVIQLRRVVDGPGQSITRFFADMTEKIRVERPRNLVVDMRMNGGGNLQNARDFMGSLPSLVPGRIFVITAPSTFSAAISSVGYLKQAAPDRVAIVGQEAGDRLVFFAEGRPATAPHSKMMIGIATQRHDYQNGCKAFTDCHGPVVRFPIAVATLQPDIPAPLTFGDWRAGRDPALEAIKAALKR